MAALSNLAASISDRAKETFAYYPAHVKCTTEHPYSNTCTTGGISLCLAENKLCTQLLIQKMKEFKTYSRDCLCYQDPSGSINMKQILANMMEKHIFHTCHVNTDHLVVMSGCTSILYQLSVLLFNPEDSLLIPVPYYPVFIKDFKSIGQIHIQDVLSDPSNDFAFSLSHLETAYHLSISNGHTPKALLLTNPHNPTGTIMSGALVRAAVAWCRSKSMHCIVDEIYALSTFDGVFESVVSLLDGVLGNDVHVLWGLSKDLGASGLRVGVLYSQNEELLSASKAISDPFVVSAPVQEMVVALLNDDVFLHTYIEENKQRLRTSYTIVVDSLHALGIRTIPAVSAIFAFVDMRSLLPEQSFDGEKRLFDTLNTRGVVLTPGLCCRCPEPGFFRICYAWVSVQELRVALNRIALYADEVKASKAV